MPPTTSPILASLQRGARNFMGYCLGCHGLKYERYSRLGRI
jgi:ubiquinol-cytochrome c reductase cytochrome c1 subunit